MKTGFGLAIVSGIALIASSCAPVERRIAAKPLANPSAVVAAELAFARLAQERGQWAAFRQTALRDAEMFVPQRVRAQEWLNGRAEPATAVKWQPHKVAISCDGTAAMATGAAQWPDGSHSFFTTIWLRQPNGEWKWLLDHGGSVAAPIAAPEAVSTRVAACTGSPPAEIMAPAEGVDFKLGLSRDQSLTWSSTVSPDGGRRIVVKAWNGRDFEVVQDDRIGSGWE